MHSRARLRVLSLRKSQLVRDICLASELELLETVGYDADATCHLASQGALSKLAEPEWCARSSRESFILPSSFFIFLCPSLQPSFSFCFTIIAISAWTPAFGFLDAHTLQAQATTLRARYAGAAYRTTHYALLARIRNRPVPQPAPGNATRNMPLPSFLLLASLGLSCLISISYRKEEAKSGPLRCRRG